MTPPCSEDLRERALARADAGETVRSIAILCNESPGKIGGHKKPVLSGANIDWLRKRVLSRPFTLRKLT
jgi:hypothetical protein